MLPLREKSEVRGIQASELGQFWPIAKPLIQKALDRGSDYSIDEVYMGLMRTEMQLWMWGDEAALVTAIQTDRGQKFCLLLACGGTNMSDWFQYFPHLEAWAKSKGCDAMRLYGRRGWARVTGYKVCWTKMEKEL